MSNLSNRSDLLVAGLESWYAEQCDGDWEHSWGLSIQTIDNPGWRVEIDLLETAFADIEIAFSREERSASDWIQFKVHDGKFEGAGGVGNLAELLRCFLEVVRP
jgi:Immunity protein 53